MVVPEFVATKLQWWDNLFLSEINKETKSTNLKTLDMVGLCKISSRNGIIFIWVDDILFHHITDTCNST